MILLKLALKVANGQGSIKAIHDGHFAVHEDHRNLLVLVADECHCLDAVASRERCVPKVVDDRRDEL